MRYQITRSSLHLQIVGAMVERIACGDWKPSVPLPNEHELSREYGVSSGTIRKALEKLESDNLIERRQGRGTFVLNYTNGELANRFNNIRDRNGQRIVPTSGRVLEQRIGLATDIEQARLNIGPNDKVLRTQRISEHAGRPHVYEEATLAIGRLPSLSENELVGHYLIASLAWKYGTYLTRASERLSFAEVPPEIARLLLVEPGVRLLWFDRIVFSRSDDPIEWRVAFCDLKNGYYLAESR